MDAIEGVGQSTEVPEEAVEALRFHVPEITAAAGTSHGAETKALNSALKAAAPALRKQGADQERQRLKEALAQPIHDLATHIGRARMEIEDLPDPPAVVSAANELRSAKDAMAALRDALDTLEADRG